MPPRRFEHYSPEPEYHHRFGYGEEEKKEERPRQQPKPEEKKPEKKPEQDKKESPKEEEKTKKKELSPEEKQERRSEAVERSQSLKKQFEETPVPNDTSTVARLIIAEHILNIDEQLQGPEVFGDARKKKELETTLDYMCDLAEKLEDPTVESPPHIQDAYESLLELTEEALQTAHTAEEVLEEVSEMLQLIPEDTLFIPPDYSTSPDSPQSPEHTAQVALAPKITPAVKNLLTYLHITSPQTSADISSDHHSQAQGTNIPSIPLTSATPQRELGKTLDHLSNSHITESLPARSRVHDAREYHLGTQPNIAKPLAAVALASIVASAIHRTPDISHRHETIVPLPTPPDHEHAWHPYKKEHKPFADLTPAFANTDPQKSLTAAHNTPKLPDFSQTSHESHTRSEPESASPSGKLEHMSLISLLSLAQDVHVGHGRYLKAEFERGRIDKDGLIKVLKAKKKGMDFSQEFNHQEAHFRERLASIEFITKPSNPIIPTDKIRESTAPSQVDEPRESSTQKEAPAHPIFERYAHPEKSFFQPSLKNTIPINFIVTLIAIIVFGALIIFLLLPT